MSNLIDLSNKQFDRLHVDGRANITEPNGRKRTMWNCTCQCGTKVTVWSHSLIAGLTRSCGCLQKEVVTTRNTTHGMSKSRLDRIWHAMKTRCYNPNVPQYMDYGGRGISIAPEWLSDPQKFFNWAIANGYRDDLTIDRINTNLGYSPENCRWVTHAEQNRNRRSCVLLTHNGETHTMAEWARITDIPYQTLKDRIRRYGWDIERALTTPVKTQS